MNQGVFFGQIVIGPAGSGKVFYVIKKFSQPIAKSCKKWHKHYAGTSSYSTSTLPPSITNIPVTLTLNNSLLYKTSCNKCN